MASFELSVQQCTIEKSIFEIENRLSSISATIITINSTYYNCLSRSDTSDHYSSMSVSILYIISDDPNSIHEVRYNLQCNNSVWEIVDNQSTALRNNNTVFCEDCTDQTVNSYHCTDYLGMDKDGCKLALIIYCLGDFPVFTDEPLDKKRLMARRQTDGKYIVIYCAS